MESEAIICAHKSAFAAIGIRDTNLHKNDDLLFLDDGPDLLLYVPSLHGEVPDGQAGGLRKVKRRQGLTTHLQEIKILGLKLTLMSFLFIHELVDDAFSSSSLTFLKMESRNGEKSVYNLQDV